jgi:hypothetical protein
MGWTARPCSGIDRSLSSNEQHAAWEEGVALGLSRELGDPDPPISAFGLAALCGLRVVAGTRGSARLVDSYIEVDTTVRPERQHGLVAHELGHWALRRAGEVDTEQAASYVGAALLLPRRQFMRDLSATRWDLRALRAKHVNCSAELIARRIVTVRDAVVSVWDNGKLKTRLASPWLPDGLRRMSRFERELAAQVLATGETVEAGALVWGFAVFDGIHHRVITVCEAEQLALRY